MFFPLSAAVLSAQLLMPVAENNIPEFDLVPSCRGASQAAISNRDAEGCLQQERAARDELRREWAQFPSRDRTTCMHSTSMGGIPSYVEMLTCLEIARDVRTLPDSTTGSGSR